MTTPTHQDREAVLLHLWERGAGLDRWRRDDSLLAHDGSLPTGLGARNAKLLAIRGSLFARPWSLRAECPACGTDLGFEINAEALTDELGGRSGEEDTVITWRGQPLHLHGPSAESLHAIGAIADERAAAIALLSLCCADTPVDFSDATDEEIETLGEHLASLDPAALVSFDVECPACAHHWSSVLDIGDTVWRELRHAAELLLLDVHAIARTYGWTEDEILRLSPTRRAAYLQLADAT